MCFHVIEREIALVIITVASPHHRGTTIHHRLVIRSCVPTTIATRRYLTGYKRREPVTRRSGYKRREAVMREEKRWGYKRRAVISSARKEAVIREEVILEEIITFARSQ